MDIREKNRKRWAWIKERTQSKSTKEEIGKLFAELNLLERTSDLVTRTQEEVSVIVKKPTFVLPPSGKHHVTLSGVEDLGMVPNSYNGGKLEPRIKLTWTFNGGNTLFAWMKPSLDDRATFHKVVEALVGAVDEVNPDTLVGGECFITVKHKQANGKTRAIITDYWASEDGNAN